MICDFTKYLIAIPIPNKEAKTIAQCMFENLLLIYGNVSEIRSDRGTEFNNEVIRELCALMGIRHEMSTPYRHQTVGAIERNHRTLNEYLRAYLKDDKTDWPEFVKYYSFCYNTSPNTAINNFTPFELVFAKRNSIGNNFNQNKHIDPIYNVDNYSKEVKYRLQLAYDRVRKCIEKCKIKNKSLYDTNINPIKIEIGDNVLVRDEARHKLDKIYNGPYKVIGLKSANVIIEDQKSNKTFEIHKNRIIKYE